MRARIEFESGAISIRPENALPRLNSPFSLRGATTTLCVGIQWKSDAEGRKKQLTSTAGNPFSRSRAGLYSEISRVPAFDSNIALDAADTVKSARENPQYATRIPTRFSPIYSRVDL